MKFYFYIRIYRTNEWSETKCKVNCHKNKALVSLFHLLSLFLYLFKPLKISNGPGMPKPRREPHHYAGNKYSNKMHMIGNCLTYHNISGSILPYLIYMVLCILVLRSIGKFSDWNSLKGPWHEIFDLWFFSPINPT
jgi:hypothetical protein